MLTLLGKPIEMHLNREVKKVIRPNYIDFKRSQFVVGNGQTIQHSAEGSSWKKHKYIKKVDGTYYYPDSYKGGRHLPDGEKEKSMEDELFEKLKNSSDKDIGQMLRGSFDKILLKQMGVDWTKLPKEEVDRMQRSLIDRLEGKTESNERKDLLDENYEEVQKRVNELVKGSAGSKTIPSDAISVDEDVTKKAIPFLLDENYEEVQKRLNELVKGSAGSKTIPSDKTKAISVAEDATKKAAPFLLDENYEEVQRRLNELVKGVPLVDAYRNKKTK